jgi:hypothetical protein
MKTKNSILVQVFFILIIVFCFFSCDNTTEPTYMKDTHRGTSFTLIVVDDCEYIYLNNWFAHKGNCKYCKQRSLK